MNITGIKQQIKSRTNINPYDKDSRTRRYIFGEIFTRLTGSQLLTPEDK